MINVTLCLTSDREFNFECPESGPLFDQLDALVSGLSEHQIDGSKIVQLQIDDSRGSRSIALSPRSIVSIETDPAHLFGGASGNVMAQTAPYVRIPDFLPQAARDEILNFALVNEDDFDSSTIKNSAGKGNHLDLQIRKSSVVTDLNGLPGLFETELRDIALDIAQVLELDISEDYKLELQLTAHNDGAYYKMHRDNNTPSSRTRLLTFVYYFHQVPKGFDGGQVRLFDTLEDSFAVAETFVDIEPEDNSLLFFPSGVPHEVLNVDCPSKSFENSRFTLNGWLHTRQ